MTKGQEAQVLSAIKRFNKECEQSSYTDTGDAWELLNWIKELLEGGSINGNSSIHYRN